MSLIAITMTFVVETTLSEEYVCKQAVTNIKKSMVTVGDPVVVNVFTKEPEQSGEGGAA